MVSKVGLVYVGLLNVTVGSINEDVTTFVCTVKASSNVEN